MQAIDSRNLRQVESWGLDQLIQCNLVAINRALGGNDRLNRLDSMFECVQWSRIARDVLERRHLPDELTVLLTTYHLVFRFGYAMQNVIDADTAVLACRLVPDAYREAMRSIVYTRFVRSRIDTLCQTFTTDAYEHLLLGPRQHIDTLCQNYVDTLSLDRNSVCNLKDAMQKWRDACPIPDIGVRVSEMAARKLAGMFPVGFTRQLVRDISLAKYVQDEPDSVMNMLVARAKVDMHNQRRMQETLDVCQQFGSLDPFVYVARKSTRMLAPGMVTVRSVRYIRLYWPHVLKSDIEPCVLDAAQHAIRSMPLSENDRPPKLIGLCPFATTADVVINGRDVRVPMILARLLAKVANQDPEARNDPYYRQLLAFRLVDSDGQLGTEFASSVPYVSPEKLATLKCP